MAENDSLDELMKILDQWCQVSGVKFNIEKTKVTLIGTDQYCQILKEMGKLNEQGSAILETIHIATDKEVTRILGAWVGNDMDLKEPWRPIVEMIKKTSPGG